MAERSELEAALRRVLAVLQPYAADVVLIGGWVPFLHQKYGEHTQWKGELSLTAEADVMLRERVLAANKRPPVTTLLADAGLEPSSRTAKTSAIWRSAAGGVEEVEFLVPMPGPLHKKPLVDVVGQPGLAALTLIDLHILGRRTVVVRLPATGDSSALDVRIPTLGAYVLHKSATFHLRVAAADAPRNSGRAKDLLYLRDVMAAGSAVVEAVEDELAQLGTNDPDGARLCKTGQTNLAALATRFADEFALAAEMLTEREPAHTDAAARADLAGHLGDLRAILRGLTRKAR